MPTPAETISTLHTKIVDAAKGYEEATEIAKRANVGDLCAELRRTHLTNAHTLSGFLVAHDVRPDTDGSYMSVVHKAALNLRFAFTADEKSLLPGLRDGEKRILEAYDDVLREVDIANGAFSGDEAAALRSQREMIVANVGKIDAMQAESA
jgi:uncharacterized protein (TIGR02284 family)